MRFGGAQIIAAILGKRLGALQRAQQNKRPAGKSRYQNNIGDTQKICVGAINRAD